MGVLDDAIREHLDLKRARGADPTEIERLEREALGPVRRERGMGVSQLDAPEQHAPALSSVDAPTEYHDSTAPHTDAPHLNLAGAHAQEDGVPVEEEEAPRRRGFLRRSRGAAPTRAEHTTSAADVEHEMVPEHHGEPEYIEGSVQFEPAHDEPLYEDPILHEEPLHYDEPLHDEPLHDEPLRHDEPVQHEEPMPPEQARSYDEPAQDVAPEPHDELPLAPQPPPLAFDAPPPRPRFTPEPPTTVQPAHVDDDPAESQVEPALASDEPAPVHAERHEEPQPTREFDVLGEAEEETEPEEDVLEETPEFLQDTPEHDRLWFEQRPPKDFDFDG